MRHHFVYEFLMSCNSPSESYQLITNLSAIVQIIQMLPELRRGIEESSAL